MREERREAANDMQRGKGSEAKLCEPLSRSPRAQNVTVRDTVFEGPFVNSSGSAIANQ